MPHDLTFQKAGTKYTNIHHPIISYNEITDKYYITNTCILSSKHIPETLFLETNPSGTPDLIGQDNIFAISQSTYQFKDNKFTYLDSQLYFPPNSGSDTSPTTSNSGDIIDLNQILIHSVIWSGTGHVAAGWYDGSDGHHNISTNEINFTLNLDPSNLEDDSYKYIKFIYDFNDGGDLEVVSRSPIKSDISLQLLDNTAALDDPTNPKYISKSHTYTFTSSATTTQTAYVSAITSSQDIHIYGIDINRTPSSIVNSFSSLHLIESKSFMDSNFTENNLILLESQNPRYIMHMALKGNKYNKTEFNY